MKHFSIRWRLTLWYAVAFGTLLTAFCLILLVLTRQQLLARTDNQLREELRELAREIELARSPREFSDQLQARFFQHDIYDFAVSDAHGQPLFVSSRVNFEQAKVLLPASNGAMTEAQNGDWIHADKTMGTTPHRVATTVVNGPQGRLTVQSLTSLAPLHAELQTLQLLMLTLLPVGIVFALVGGYFLAARALAPVDQIARVAAGITISGLDQRVEVSNPHDELGRLALTINSLIGRLERAVAEIQRFTADASHELRTPLAILRSEAECALRKSRTVQEYERTLTVVVDEATRLGRLADQLLTLSRADTGASPIPRECVRLDALLLDVAETFEPLAARQKVRVECDQLTPCELLGDDIRLSQAFSNVLENALKFTRPGGIVRVQLHLQSKLATISITDTGIGIAAAHLAHVFDRFYRVDTSRHSQSGGTGLGLSIAQSAVTEHQGTISMESKPDVGTTVTICLPASQPAAESDPHVRDHLEARFSA